MVGRRRGELLTTRARAPKRGAGQRTVGQEGLGVCGTVSGAKQKKIPGPTPEGFL